MDLSKVLQRKVPTFTCPWCAAQLLREELLRFDPDGGEYVPTGRNKRPPVTAYAARLAAMHRAALRCPRPDCLKDLPDGFGDRPTFSIGLVGAPYSSKTHLIYAVVRQLTSARGPLSHLNYSFHLDEFSRERFHRNYAEQGDQNKRLTRTQLADTEAITVIAQRHGRSVNLVFFDASGEMMTARGSAAQVAGYMFAADAFWLVLAPESIEILQEHAELALIEGYAPEKEQMMLRQSEQQLMDVVSTLNGQLASRLASTDAPKYRPLLHVLVAKGDLLLKANVVDSGLLNELPYKQLTARELVAEINDTSQTVFALLNDWQMGNLLEATSQHFDLRTFHLVSATGASPTENHMYLPLLPARVLDALTVDLDFLGRRNLL